MAGHIDSFEGDSVAQGSKLPPIGAHSEIREGETFVPALGFKSLTPFYDTVLGIATREAIWRAMLIEQVAPRSGETIVDVGCGTGTLAIMLKRRAPGARVIGIDPDPAVLAIAARKAAQAGIDVDWQRGFARSASEIVGPRSADKLVSSLLFHQVPVIEKRAGLASMFEAVRPGGEIHIADYARQDGFVRKMLFSTIGMIDGLANTRPNAGGLLEELLAELTGATVRPTRVVPTITGAISLFACTPLAASENGRK